MESTRNPDGISTNSPDGIIMFWGDNIAAKITLPELPDKPKEKLNKSQDFPLTQNKNPNTIIAISCRTAVVVQKRHHVVSHKTHARPNLQ